jgi:hypothetical protein
MATFTIEVSEAEKYIIDVNTSTADSFTSSSSQDKFFLEIEQGIAGTAETTKNIIEITTSVDSASDDNSITIEKVNDIYLVITTDFVVSHPTIPAASSVDNNGSLFIQDIFLDQYGHITGINSAYATGTGIGGAPSTFLDLTDTPLSFSGQNSKIVSVNSSESALEFTLNRPKRSYKTISADYTISSNDDILLLDSSSQELQINMPYASGAEGYSFTIKKIAGNYNCIINPQSGESIDSRDLLNVHYVNESMSLFSNGNTWYII